MAQELDDGEFWLPSQFLTDDDILMDFAKSDGFGSGFGSGSSSDLGSLTTETEISDDDDLLLPGLTRRFSRSSLNDCPVHSKVPGLSSSPQSTLCGCECNHQGSSHGSPTGPVSPQPQNDAVKAEKCDKKDNDDKTNTAAADNKKNNKNATLDLLNKAAGEVAKMKMRSDRSTGTGFFDCSNSAKGLLFPPQPPLPQRNPPPHYPPPPPYYSHPQFRHFPPHMMWGSVQLPPPQPQQQLQQQQNRVTKNNTTTTNNKTSNGTTNGNTRPLGLPPSAWPPLPGQTAQSQPQPQPPQPQPQPMMGMYVAPPNASVGTGVFLPRRVTTPAESKKKTDGNATKAKNNKASQKRNPRPAKANDDAILLPSEWVY